MISLLLAAALLLAPDANPAAAASGGTPLRVSTFNIRYGKAKDGENAWDKRRDLFMRTVKNMDPDLLGMQEVLAFQLDEIKAAFPDREFVGVGRDDGKQAGEFSPVAFRTSRFEKLADGTFWLSETPEKVGSKGWDAALPRIATWVRLKDKQSGQTLLYVNTHFDHLGKQARAESAKLLRTRVDAMRGDVPVIITGDFNAGEDEPPYANLRGPRGDAARFVDSYRAVHPDLGPEDGTFNDFKGKRDGKRIDWILHTPDLKTQSCEIVHDSEAGHYPSDHFPVAAVLTIGAAAKP
jgi:endonuclease/exonuclease/phosphatase family metal-dependent hydrolase